jgi:hypothetical protein
VKIVDSDQMTIKRTTLSHHERQAAGLPSAEVGDYRRVIHPDGKTLVGYVRGNWEYEMVSGTRYRSGTLTRQGYDTFGPDGKRLGYGSNVSGAKWSLAQDWNRSLGS